jgi:hypothetical protein
MFLQNFCKTDASVKSTLPPRFWGVGVVFEAFYGLLAVASKLYRRERLQKNGAIHRTLN